jgi:small-conductance mechanosensitive channel
MLGGLEMGLLAGSMTLLSCSFIPRLRVYRPILWGSSALLLITTFFPRAGNLIGQRLFQGGAGSGRLPIELFGVAWWILGAWLLSSLLDLVLRRTIFPHDNQPHARRLFADLAAGMIYVVALVGIMDTVFKQPISTVLATSGVLAIVLGLALQNTLADVFAGLALNIERSFQVGNWLTLSDAVEGQLIEINWRAMRIKTASNDMIVIPNSVVSKSIVRNHRRLNLPHVFIVSLTVDHQWPPSDVIPILEAAARGAVGLAPDSVPVVFARTFTDSLISYDINCDIEEFPRIPAVQSLVISKVTRALHLKGIQIGSTGAVVRLVRVGPDGESASAMPTHPVDAPLPPPPGIQNGNLSL